MKRDKCKKCKKKHLLENHHPLTREKFGKNKAAMQFKEEICGSCHNDFHDFIKGVDMKTETEFLFAWYYWLYGLIIIGTGLFVILT